MARPARPPAPLASFLVCDADERTWSWLRERLAPCEVVGVETAAQAVAAVGQRGFNAIVVGAPTEHAAALIEWLCTRQCGPVFALIDAAGVLPSRRARPLSRSLSPHALRSALLEAASDRGMDSSGLPSVRQPSPPFGQVAGAGAIAAARSWPSAPSANPLELLPIAEQPTAPLVRVDPVAEWSPTAVDAVPPADRGRGKIGAALRRVAMQPSTRDSSGVMARELAQLIDADRARCLYVDAEAATLAYEADEPGDDFEVEGLLGLAGEALRRGVCLAVERAGDAPQYCAAVDDLGLGPKARLLVQPVHGAEELHAVWIAARDGRGAPFDARERAIAADFAAACGPLLDALSWGLEAQPVASEASVFRPEAIDAHRRRRDRGHVVRVHSPWVNIVYWIIVAFFAAAAVYLCVGRVGEYASGVAVVVADERSDALAELSGVLEAVVVEPGERVQAGQVVAQLRDEGARAELAALQHQFDRRLIERLMDPRDAVAGQALVELSARREQAERAVERHSIRAPRSGVAGEVLLRSGATVAAGAPILSVVAADPEMSVLAAIPAARRPLIELGDRARVSLAGHRGVRLELPIVEVGDEALGPGAAARRLGSLLGDAVPITTAVVFVRVALPSEGFVIDGVTHRFHHGMAATVDIEVRSESLLISLFPGLERIF